MKNNITILILVLFLISCKADYRGMIKREAIKADLDPDFMLAMFIHESKLDPKAVGSYGEIGLGQIRYEMHKEKYNIRSKNFLYYPKYNVKIALSIFKECKEEFKTYYSSFRCYNAGARGARIGRGHRYARKVLKVKEGL